MAKSSRYFDPTIYAVIAAALYWFWAFPYRAALGFREEMQLFQTTGAYFASLAGRPGGVSVYIGEFLTQTFNNYWLGAAVVTAVLILFTWLIRQVINAFSIEFSKALELALSLLPLTALWLFLGNPDVTMAFPVALLCVLGGTMMFICESSPSDYIGRCLHMLALTAFLYWLAGPVTVVFTLLIIAYAIKDKAFSLMHKILFSILTLVWSVINFYGWSLVMTSYPVSCQLIGIGYLLKPDVLEGGQIIVEVLCVVIPVAVPIFARVPSKILTPSSVGFAIAIGMVCYPKCYDATTYRLIDYDYMVRANDWEGILGYSDRHDPDLPLSVSATNLALGMTGQLDTRAFDYFQNGPEGLIPPFTKEAISSWTTGEILFQLGMVNSAQRFYFEGMEAIPNYNKSVRAVKRLAETAIIRGDYRLAEKYLRLLENTSFYRNWARRNLELIRNPQSVAAHPFYGVMRNRMLGEDYLFSEGELDKTLGQLFMKDASNELAKQYLVVYPLLQRDLDKFSQYMGVVAEKYPEYNPALAQQALAFMAMKNGQPIPQGMVSPVYEQKLRGFAQAWTSKNPDLIAPHRRTLYHYLISNE